MSVTCTSHKPAALYGSMIDDGLTAYFMEFHGENIFVWHSTMLFGLRYCRLIVFLPRVHLHTPMSLVHFLHIIIVNSHHLSLLSSCFQTDTSGPSFTTTNLLPNASKSLNEMALTSELPPPRYPYSYVKKSATFPTIWPL